MMKFHRSIKDYRGDKVGEFEGAICSGVEDAFRAMNLTTDKEFIKKYADRIDGGIRLPCAVLIEIDVNAEVENQGFGSNALAEFDAIARENHCSLAFVRVGWNGNPVSGKKAKNLYFYSKNGWIPLYREELDLPLMCKTIDL